jgi:transposase
MIQPPFCPRPSCAYHRRRARKPPGWYTSAGTYRTDALGTVRRFRCSRCGRYFSTQPFSIDYYSKRTVSYRRLFTHLVTTSSIRDMARDFGVSADVVGNKISRLGRNCLAVHQRLQRAISLAEPLAADGL